MVESGQIGPKVKLNQPRTQLKVESN